MIEILGAAMVFSVIACVAPIYYCRKLNEEQDKDKSIVSESPVVHIKISHSRQNEPATETVLDTPNSRRISIDSHECREIIQRVREVEPVSTEASQIVPVKTPRSRRRMSARIWSSAMRDQLQNITNSSSEVYGSTRVVRAQVERVPADLETNNGTKSLRCSYNSLHGSSKSSNSNEEKSKRPSRVALRWKNLKRTLNCTRAEPRIGDDTRFNDGQRPSAPFQAANQPSMLENTRVAQKSRLGDVSSSTRMSGNVLSTQSDGAVAKARGSQNDDNASDKQSRNDRKANASEDALREAVSLIKRRSVNGKSICDVKISGLAMNQSQLLDLFEKADGRDRSASIRTTKDASIISIKFHRQKSSGDISDANQASRYEQPFDKFYRSLSEIFEDLSISKLFRSNEVQEMSDRVAHPIRDTDHSATMYDSRNETSYLAFPNFAEKFLNSEQRFGRSSTLSRKFCNSNVHRFVDERQI